MRNVLAFAAAAVLVFLGLGWYFNWYQVKAVPTGQGHQSYTIDIDQAKIGKDVQTFEKSIEQKKREHDASVAAQKKPAENVAAQPSGAQAKGIVQTAEELIQTGVGTTPKTVP